MGSCGGARGNPRIGEGVPVGEAHHRPWLPDPDRPAIRNCVESMTRIPVYSLGITLIEIDRFTLYA